VSPFGFLLDITLKHHEEGDPYPLVNCKCQYHLLWVAVVLETHSLPSKKRSERGFLLGASHRDYDEGKVIDKEHRQLRDKSTTNDEKDHRDRKLARSTTTNVHDT
jgi:hypothetical protein